MEPCESASLTRNAEIGQLSEGYHYRMENVDAAWQLLRRMSVNPITPARTVGAGGDHWDDLNKRQKLDWWPSEQRRGEPGLGVTNLWESWRLTRFGTGEPRTHYIRGSGPEFPWLLTWLWCDFRVGYPSRTRNCVGSWSNLAQQPFAYANGILSAKVAFQVQTV